MAHRENPAFSDPFFQDKTAGKTKGRQMLDEMVTPKVTFNFMTKDDRLKTYSISNATIKHRVVSDRHRM
jgi:hypothetical protein